MCTILDLIEVVATASGPGGALTLVYRLAEIRSVEVGGTASPAVRPAPIHHPEVKVLEVILRHPSALHLRQHTAQPYMPSESLLARKKGVRRYQTSIR